MANSDNKIIPTKVVYLDRNTLPENISIRPLNVPHQWVNFASTTFENVIDHSQGADVLVLNKVPITDDTLEACPTIKHIAVSATGYNIIDLEACQRRGISVSNIQNYALTTVPEHVIMLALNLRRELQHHRQLVIDGQWQTSSHFCLIGKPIKNLSSAIFGVIGFGELGRETAKLANALGMQVIFSSRSKHICSFASQVTFDELISQADVISLHCSLNAQTHNLIDIAEFEAMQDHAILINTARGGIVNEAAAVDAIRHSMISGLGVDVLEQEPPINGSPLLSIAHLPNVIITPHIAWGSSQAIQRLADILVDNIEAFLNGTPQNIVT